ncbi:hypothetical protein GF406_19565 [candidate division KSB1 bacterium]|nr:hypothetical protein [candidate division KSB1 bacterium]
MNIRTSTLAMIVVLAYEIVLKLSHFLFPHVLHHHIAISFTGVLSVLAGIIIILFLILFLRAEGSSPALAWSIRALIGAYLLVFALRFALAANLFDFRTLRLLSEILGGLTAVLIFIILVLYRNQIPSDHMALYKAANIAAFFLGLRILFKLYSAIEFSRFVSSGEPGEYSSGFYMLVSGVYLLTHLSMIYFFFRYYLFKSAR